MPSGVTGPANELGRALAEAVNLKRIEAGVSNRDLIARSGLSANYYYKRMRGQAPFTTNDLEVIADALGVSPRQLFEPALAQTDSQRQDPTRRPTLEVASQRLRKLLVVRQAQYPTADTESALLASVAEHARRLSRKDWTDLLAGRALTTDDDQLAAIATFFDVHPDYLLKAAPTDVIEELDARLEVEAALAETGILGLAARSLGGATPAELRAIAQAIRDAVNKGPREGDSAPTNGKSGGRR